MRRKPPSSRVITLLLRRRVWRKLYAPPSAGDWYSESPPRKSLSPATKKRHHDELEAELDALSIHSSDPVAPEVFDPIGKTAEEIAGMVRGYKRGNRIKMAKPRRTGITGIYRAPLTYLA